MKNNKRYILSIGCVLLCGVLVCFALTPHFRQSKIENELRNKYALIKEDDYLFDTPLYTFEYGVKYSPNLVELKILSKGKDYVVDLVDSEEVVYEKIQFHQWRAKVLNVIKKTPNETFEDEIEICYADMFSSSLPLLKPGDTVLCSLESASGNHYGKYLFYDRTFYYVDNGMALAAYENDDSPAKRICLKSDLIDAMMSILEK